jgi:hypothetical protein
METRNPQLTQPTRRTWRSRLAALLFALVVSAVPSLAQYQVTVSTPISFGSSTYQNDVEHQMGSGDQDMFDTYGYQQGITHVGSVGALTDLGSANISTLLNALPVRNGSIWATGLVGLGDQVVDFILPDPGVPTTGVAQITWTGSIDFTSSGKCDGHFVSTSGTSVDCRFGVVTGLYAGTEGTVVLEPWGGIKDGFPGCNKYGVGTSESCTWNPVAISESFTDVAAPAGGYTASAPGDHVLLKMISIPWVHGDASTGELDDVDNVWIELAVNGTINVTYNTPVDVNALGFTTVWAQIPSGITAIDIGAGADGTVWMVGSDHTAYRMVADASGWEHMGIGQVQRIDVTPDGRGVVVLINEEVWEYTGGTWEHLRNMWAIDVGCGANGGVWVLGNSHGPIENNAISPYGLRGDGTWAYHGAVAGRNKRIDVAPNGTAYVVCDVFHGGGSKLFQWAGGQDWHETSIGDLEARDIALGISPHGAAWGAIWLADEDGNIHRWSDVKFSNTGNTGHGWERTNGGSIAISADDEGNVLSIAHDGSIWQGNSPDSQPEDVREDSSM